MTPFVVEHAHSEVGASASDRWIPCPGSVLLTRGMADPGSIYAAEGTAAHTVSEWCRVQQKPASTFRGQVLKVDEFEFTVDDEMIAAVDEFCEYVEAIPGVPLYETRVSYGEYVPGGFGTLDDGRLAPYVCSVTDFKYGEGVKVFAKNNTQLMLYALGLYLRYRWLYAFDKFVLTVHQPRLEHIDVWETDLAALLVWAAMTAQPIAAQALLPGAPFKAGDHCQFCPAKMTCRVRAEAMIVPVSGEFTNLDAPRVTALLSNAEVAALLPYKELVARWWSDLEHHALSELAKGNPVGDWKVVEGRSNRVWRITDAHIASRLADEGVSVDDIWSREIVSPAQAESLLGGKKKAEPILAELIHKPKGKPKLAPGTDPRPAMVIDVGTEFTDLDSEDLGSRQFQ